MSGARGVRRHSAAGRRECAIEEHGLDAVVVVEVFEVAEVGDRGGNMGVEVGGAVRGELSVVGIGEGGDLPPHGVTAASGDVGLKAVDGFAWSILAK